MGQDSTSETLSNLAKQWREIHSHPPPVLYHYTDAPGLLGILRGCRLWATNARYMNDPSEITYAVRQVNRVASAAKASLSLSQETETAPPTSLIDKVLQWLNNKIFEKLIQELDVPEATDKLVQVLETQGGVYVVCFCENGDLLSQWRGYGGAGSGYAIGLESKEIGQLDYSRVTQKAILRRVIYKPEEQEEILTGWIQSITELHRTLREKIRQRFLNLSVQDKAAIYKRMIEDQIEGPEIASLISNAEVKRLTDIEDAFDRFLAECLICFKDPAYQEEHEWRAIQFRHSNLQVAFRSRRTHILPYVELDITNPHGAYAERLPVYRIIFGPALEPRATINSLTMLTETYGYLNPKIEVVHSRIPYRE